MSLYNMCVGNNPLFGLLARVLETAAPLPQVERFRDAYTTDTHIVIYTRLGGGNRKDYVACHEALRRHPLFASDHDDDFDQTFCHHLFRIPDDFQEDIVAFHALYCRCEKGFAPQQKFELFIQPDSFEFPPPLDEQETVDLIERINSLMIRLPTKSRLEIQYNA